MGASLGLLCLLNPEGVLPSGDFIILKVLLSTYVEDLEYNMPRYYLWTF